MWGLGLSLQSERMGSELVLTLIRKYWPMLGKLGLLKFKFLPKAALERRLGQISLQGTHRRF